jgi:hypothetical protein
MLICFSFLLSFSFLVKNEVKATCTGSTQCCTKAEYICRSWIHGPYGSFCTERDSFKSCVAWGTYNCGYTLFSGATRCAVICPEPFGSGGSGYTEHGCSVSSTSPSPSPSDPSPSPSPDPICPGCSVSCSAPSCRIVNGVQTNDTYRPNCLAEVRTDSKSCVSYWDNDSSKGICYRDSCSASRSCYYVEYSPRPTDPTAIDIEVAGQRCDLGGNIRIPYPNYGNIYGFLARGSRDLRAGESIGQTPTLKYEYRFLSAVSPLTTARYYPYLNVNQGNEYVVSARAATLNRCSSYTFSGSISRNFIVNHVPRIISVTPVVDPNDGVSGNIDLDASKIIDDYDCDIDNPKVFRVVFEDLDGCGDIWSGASANTNICGGAKTRNLSLRAVRRGTSTVFASSNSPRNISCSGNRITADFTLTFRGNDNFLLDLQAFAADIVGNTSGWVQPSGAVWSYDGQGPSVEIDSSVVMGADQLNVDWSAVDNINTLSGIQNVRILSKLTKGTILLSDDYYGPITYKDSSVPVHGDFDNYVLSWDSGMYPPSQSRNNLSLISSDLVDIGVNQDGALDFKIEAVDRACNFSMDSSPTPLGSPWIATRGGFVYSQGNINLSMRQSSYDGILGMLGDELTALSTELASSGGGFSDDILGNPEYVYTLSEYSDENARSWYDIFRRRALLGIQKVIIGVWFQDQSFPLRSWKFVKTKYMSIL